MKMRYWYFRDRFGYKWEVKEVQHLGNDRALTLSVFCEYQPAYSMTYHDWTELDRMQADGRLTFMYETNRPMVI